MEVYIPCCDASLPMVKINSYLFNKLWPEVTVNYLGFKKPDFNLYSNNHFFHSLAPEQVGGSSKWTRYIYDFLKNINDSHIIFSLDDYFLCTQPDYEMLKVAQEFCKNNPKVGRFDLTFDCQVEGNIYPIKKIKNHQISVKHPKASYRISTQPAIWDLKFLLKFLNNDWSPWEFELRGTDMAKKNKEPQQTFCFSDTKMRDYPIRTTAKGAVSRHNPNKINVLGMPTDLIRHLVEENFISEDELIWGQHADSPPSFHEKGGYDFHPYLLDFHPTSKTNFEEYFSIYDKEEPVLTVNLWDNNFIHTISHPEFGYITSQGEKAPRGRKLRYLPKLREFNYSSGITIFTDNFLNSRALKSVDSPIKIGWIQEPPVVHSTVYKEIPNYIDELDYLLTFSKDLANKYEKCHEFSWCYLRIDEKDWGIHKKNKLVSMIASNKKWAPGHVLRHKVAEQLGKKYNIDLWGGGFKSFPSLGKINALKDHMFSIVIQNCQFDTFFTDFVDPLVTGTVPIFWGTKEVCNIFNEDGIIVFDTIEELDSILSNLTEEDYYKRLPAIKENFEIAKTYWRSDDQLADKIKQIIGDA